MMKKITSVISVSVLLAATLSVVAYELTTPDTFRKISQVRPVQNLAKVVNVNTADTDQLSTQVDDIEDDIDWVQP